ncbi:MAG: uroporphyrinogen decarboxylase family protein, partial [Lentisphaeria bacterium]|nr:uroporphyrinogen decarboxylase family protein [Lentisphaeria bacterium]
MLAAINLEPVDRIPTDIWATDEVRGKLRDHFGENADIRSELHIDGMAGVSPEYIGPPLPEMPDGESIDFWGIRRKRVAHEGGAYDEQSFSPLAGAQTVSDLDSYRWPTTDWFDYSAMPGAAADIRKSQIVWGGYMAPFYYHNLLRGLEQSLIDPLLDPQLTDAVVNRISDFFYEHHRRMFEVCEGLIDVAEVTDDLGSQTGPLISLDLYREFYAPHHQRFIDLCHEFGIKVIHHDD